MCRSTKVSVVSWSVTALIAAYVIIRNKPNGRWQGLFVLTFILIQIIEAAIWSNRYDNPDCNNCNNSSCDVSNINDNNGVGGAIDKSYDELFTRLILIALFLQPLVQTFGAWKYGDFSGKYGHVWKNLMMIFVMVFCVLLLYAIFSASDKDAEFGTNKGPNGHLEWFRTNGDGGFIGPWWVTGLYILGLGVGLLFMKPRIYGIIFLAFGFLTLWWSSTQGSGSEIGSLWCFYAVLYVILVLILTESTKKF